MSSPRTGWCRGHRSTTTGGCWRHATSAASLPWPTYNHFSTPHCFAAAGGWDSDTAAERFGTYAETVTRHIGDLIPWVCTINEPNIVSMLVHARMAPVAERREDDGRPPKCHAGDQAAPSGDPGRLVSRVGRHAGREGGEATLERVRRLAQLDWLDVSKDDDWVGVQTYSRELFGPNGKRPVPDGAATSMTGWEVYRDALSHTVRLAHEHTGRPVLVTENGMVTADDAELVVYTRGALRGLAEMIADGVDVRGYWHWTLLDNFEWVSGYMMTFGLIAVDRTTFVRTPKPPLAWLGEVARRNAVD